MNAPRPSIVNDSGVLPFLVDNVGGPLLLVILGAIGFRVLTILRRRRNYLVRALPIRVRRLEYRPFRIARDRISIVYGLVPPSAAKLPYHMVEEGDVAALHSVTSLLSVIYGRDNIEVENHCDIQSQLQQKLNVFVMSGPIWNEVTELYVGLAGSPVTWELCNGDTRLVVRPKPKDGSSSPVANIQYMETIYVGKHRPKKCYGLIIAAKVKLGHVKQRVVVMGGNSNLSTYGGALFLNALYSDKEMQNQLSQHKLWAQDRWAVVFCVDNWAERSPGKTDIPPMKVGVLRLSIAHVFVEDDFLEPFEYHLPTSSSP